MKSIRGVGAVDGENSRGTMIVIHVQLLVIVSKSLSAVILLVAFPCIRPMIQTSSDANLHKLPVLLHELVEEQLLEKGHKGVAVEGIMQAKQDDLAFLRDAGIDLIFWNDTMEIQGNANQVFDFMLTSSLHENSVLNERILKDGGLAIFFLGEEEEAEEWLLEMAIQGNFQISYIKNHLIAMRKVG